MRAKQQAFTLVELLAVLAIIAALSALLLPVLQSARASAQRTTCISNFHQAATANVLYLTDFEDRFSLTSYQPGPTQSPVRDRTWVQLLLPYINTFSIFECPSDTGRTRVNRSTFDEDLVPGDTYSRYYSASLRSNIGMNYLYLSPIVRQNNAWTSQPRSISEVSDPGRTILYIDSAWEVVRSKPRGGGRWLVIPPCRYEQRGAQVVDTFSQSSGENTFYSSSNGWGGTGAYGGVWPWHTGRSNVVRVDGSAMSYRVDQLSNGCQYQAQWQGKIVDTSNYLWDLR